MRLGLVVLTLMGLFSIPTGAALLPGGGPVPHDPTPHAPNAVQAAYELRVMERLDALELRLRLDVLEAQLQGDHGVPAQQIRDGGDQVRQVFETAVRARILQEVKAAFPHAAAQILALTFDYGTTDLDENLYAPGIRVHGTVRIPLTNDVLGLPEARTTRPDSLAHAFLYSGGRVVIDRFIQVPPGFDAHFAVTVPDFLRLDAGGANGTRLEFPRDNLLGQAPKPLRLRFGLALAPGLIPGNVAAGPVVRATFLAHDETPLWLQLVPFTHGRYSADLDLWIELHSLRVDDFQRSPLPRNVQLETISADLLRVAIQEHLVGADELHDYFANIITESLQEGFGKAARITIDQEAFQTSLGEPIGAGPIQPLLIHAKAHLPLKSDKMLLASAVGRSVGMITGMPAKFTLDNQGSWGSHLTLLYPEDVDIEASDSLGRLQEIRSDGREGFTLALSPGETTDVRVHGRPGFQPLIFLLGALELAALVALGWWLTLKVQALRHTRKAPWAPRS